MREITLSHKLERDNLLTEKYIPRDLLKKAKESISQKIVKVIVGPRRAGKSVFSLQLLRELDFAYLNFDDERILATKDYDEIIKGIKEVYGNVKYILFDEIQNLQKWELFINRLHRRGYNLILTGSNSRLLSRELSAHLTGRHIQYQILPFSFNEFLKAKRVDAKDFSQGKEDQGRILFYLDEYLKTGGFPEVVLTEVNRNDYLRILVDSVILKDVVKRYNIRYTQKLYELALYLINNHSQEFSSTKLKNILGLGSIHTVENYISYLEEAFVVFRVKRFSFKFKEQIQAPQKVYAYDTGVINAVKFKLSLETGKLLENLVAVELIRRGEDFYYYKNPRGWEVDFVLKKGMKASQLIQVCYELRYPEARKREHKALIKASSDLGCNNLMVITWDEEGEINYKDKLIKYLPLWKWLYGKGA